MHALLSLQGTLSFPASFRYDDRCRRVFVERNDKFVPENSFQGRGMESLLQRALKEFMAVLAGGRLWKV
jgi:hypothetical protein